MPSFPACKFLLPSRRPWRGLAVLLLAAGTLAGCGHRVAVLKNADTGQTAECKTFFVTQTGPTSDTEVCVHYYESLGFQPVTSAPGQTTPPAPGK